MSVPILILNSTNFKKSANKLIIMYLILSVIFTRCNTKHSVEALYIGANIIKSAKEVQLKGKTIKQNSYRKETSQQLVISK